jgi:hypothetical protein
MQERDILIAYKKFSWIALSIWTILVLFAAYFYNSTHDNVKIFL